MRPCPVQKPRAWMARWSMLERTMVGGLLLVLGFGGAIVVPPPQLARAATEVVPTDTTAIDTPTVVPMLPTATAEPMPEPTLEPTPTDAVPSATSLATLVPPVSPTTEPTVEATVVPTVTVAATASIEPIGIPPATATPTEAPTPTATATATPNAGEPPLMLTKRASQAQVAPGATFSYLLQIKSTSAVPLGVRVRDQIDPQLLAVSAGASSGSCQIGSVVQCMVLVTRDAPATVQISVQVRSDVALGALVVSQATARDDANNAVSSEPVAVTVMEPNSAGVVAPTPSDTSAPPLPPRATATPNPNTATPAVSGRITGTVIELTSGAPMPGIAVQVGDGIVRSDSAGNYQRIGLPPGIYEIALVLTPDQGQPAQNPQYLTLGAGAVVVQHLSFTRASSVAAPPTASPTAAATATVTNTPVRAAGSALPRRAEPIGQSRVSLPATHGVPITVALLVGLLGLGLTARAVRRTRAAGARLADQSRLVSELAPLLRAAIRRQRAADSALLAMRRQSERIAELLDRRSDSKSG